MEGQISKSVEEYLETGLQSMVAVLVPIGNFHSRFGLRVEYLRLFKISLPRLYSAFKTWSRWQPIVWQQTWVNSFYFGVNSFFSLRS